MGSRRSRRAQGDAFAAMEALAAEGETFDLVVCDPPAFAPNKAALEAGLRAYERVARLAAPLVARRAASSGSAPARTRPTSPGSAPPARAASAGRGGGGRSSTPGSPGPTTRSCRSSPRAATSRRCSSGCDAPRRILLDACVLYPTVLREILIGCAAAGLFEPLWSARLLEEWARAAARLGPEGEAVARGEIAALRAAFPGAEVRVPEGSERRLWLPDPDDVHVLAAAVAGRADAILTANAQGLPEGRPGRGGAASGSTPTGS